MQSVNAYSVTFKMPDSCLDNTTILKEDFSLKLLRKLAPRTRKELVETLRGAANSIENGWLSDNFSY